MFRNIGRKIKTLALVLFWISLASGVIASLIGGIVCFIDGGVAMIFAGIGIIIFGAAFSFLVSWIGSFFMYGFGQLIDDTEINRQTNQMILQKLDGGSAPAANPDGYRFEAKPAFTRTVPPTAPVPPAAPVRPAAPSGGWYCKKCGMKNDAGAKFCLRCGTPNDNV
jgi:hypothetical protein